MLYGDPQEKIWVTTEMEVEEVFDAISDATLVDEITRRQPAAVAGEIDYAISCIRGGLLLDAVSALQAIFAPRWQSLSDCKAQYLKARGERRQIDTADRCPFTLEMFP